MDNYCICEKASKVCQYTNLDVIINCIWALTILLVVIVLTIGIIVYVKS